MLLFPSISKILISTFSLLSFFSQFTSIALQNTTYSNTSLPYLIDDYCNIDQTKIVLQFFEEVFDYFNLNNNNNLSISIDPNLLSSTYLNNLNNSQCLILDTIFSKYYTYFQSVIGRHTISLIYYTCPICSKNFKSHLLLYLHYKLFHYKQNESLICPGDFCQSINCKRYYEYFEIKQYSNNPQAVKFNRQPVEKEENCVEELIPFYKSTCMKLVQNCFGEDEDKYYKYFKYICNEIKCGDKEKEKLTKGGNFFEVLRYVLIYIFGVFGFIYLIVVWMTKYA